jgi:hypothetical protein
MAPLADRGWSSEAMNWVVADGSVERPVISSTRHIADEYGGARTTVFEE